MEGAFHVTDEATFEHEAIVKTPNNKNPSTFQPICQVSTFQPICQGGKISIMCKTAKT
jgi:hypothetical protein